MNKLRGRLKVLIDHYADDESVMADDIRALVSTIFEMDSAYDALKAELERANSDYWFRKGLGCEVVANENKRIYKLMENLENERQRLSLFIDGLKAELEQVKKLNALTDFEGKPIDRNDLVDQLIDCGLTGIELVDTDSRGVILETLLVYKKCVRQTRKELDGVISSKMDLFIEGWDLHCEGLMMPAGVMKDGEMKTWEELLEPLTIFECKALGESEGQAYLKSVGILIK